MAINLSREDHSKIIDVLKTYPDFLTQNGRFANLQAAFQGYSNARHILASINFEGNVHIFVVQLVNYLTTYGQIKSGIEALGVLLDYLAAAMGIEKSALLTEMIVKYGMVPAIAAQETPSESGNNAPKSGDCYVFISYARPDETIAGKVADALQAAKIDYFQDIKDIQPGDMWSQKIEAGLRKANHMILLLSKASMPERKEVEREWFYFDMQKKPIYTLLVEDCDINTRLIQRQYIDARTNVDAAVAQIVDTLNQKCKP
jgi:hypothetical protein